MKLDTREVLRPYKNRRIGFEGVLIDIIRPSDKNAYHYGLVFGSVYAPNERIELDHSVIQVTKSTFMEIEVHLYQRYYFTADIEKYYKAVRVLGVPVLRDSFMLTNIRSHKITRRDSAQLAQPTMFTLNRIRNILSCKTSEINHTEQDVLDVIAKLPNDGAVEKYINEYTSSYQRGLSMNDILDVLYRKQERSMSVNA